MTKGHKFCTRAPPGDFPRFRQPAESGEPAAKTVTGCATVLLLSPQPRAALRPIAADERSLPYLPRARRAGKAGKALSRSHGAMRFHPKSVGKYSCIRDWIDVY